MRAIAATSLILFAAYAAFGQPAAGPPAFEVASVKPNVIGSAGGERHGRQNIANSPGSLSMRNVSLSSCISWAYHVKDFQISGPGWLGSERFDILAKAADSAPEDQLRLMLQTLLADRFKVALHREEKTLSVYELVVAKSGPKFHQSKSEGEMSIKPLTKLSAAVNGISMPEVADFLSKALRAPVFDKTDLKGRFDFNMDGSGYVTKDMHEEDMISALFTALQEQLGLKLESKKSPVEMLVVDHAEKVPTEN